MAMKRNILALVAMLAGLTSCSQGSESDTNNDGKVSASERAAEMTKDGYLPILPGRWKLQFQFTDIDLPRLGKQERQNLLREAAQGASGLSCLSAAEANKPGADFFGGKGAEDCTYKQFDLAGNRAKMQVVCGMGTMGKAEMNLDGTVGDTQFDFDTNIAVSVPLAGKVKMTGRMTGTHDGPCQGNE